MRLLLLLRRYFWFFLCLLLCLFSYYGNCQSGKEGRYWWDLPRYEKDTLATALILDDRGDCVADPNYGSRLSHKRTIKIFTKDAIDQWGNLEIVEYAQLKDFSAIVYNKENGVIKETHVGMEAVGTTKINKYGAYRYAVAFPRVTVGSVIHFEYKLKFDGFVAFSWTFQHSVPVLKSEYHLYLPVGNIEATIDGMLDVKIDEESNGLKSHYRMFDVPAFHEEPLMPDPRYYRSGIRFGMGFKSGLQHVYTRDRLVKYGIKRDSSLMDTNQTMTAKVFLNKDGVMSGTAAVVIDGLGAISHAKLINDDSIDYASNSVDQSIFTIEKFETKNLNSEKKHVEAYYGFKETAELPRTDSLILFDFKTVFFKDPNPFTLPTRKYPLDMGSRHDKLTTIEFSFPANYRIEQLPANARIELPDKSASFVMSVSSINEKIYVTTRLKLNKVIYNAHEYAPLKEFFLRIYAKRNEPIVLRKMR
jgi:hypothetical protein